MGRLPDAPYHYSRASLDECPADIAGEAEHWAPDVLVALGGGILPAGRPGCATTQRAYTTYRMFERLGRRPAIVLSGRGPRRTPRELDGAESLCAVARREQELSGRALGPANRRAARAEIRAATHGARLNLTESEHMCAVILRQYPEGERAPVLARMIFEADSMSTTENVVRSTAIVLRRHFRRVLVVSTPAFPAPGRTDNHTRRAVAGFRTARPSARAFRVSGLGCPYRAGGAPWALFE